VVDLRPNDQVLLYTDGVTEARDADRAFYPLQERLAKLASAIATDAAAAGDAGASGAARTSRAARASGARGAAGKADGDVLALLRADLLRHVGAPLDDDAALLLVRAPAAWPRPPRAGLRAAGG
jgi:hypothetical protein